MKRLHIQITEKINRINHNLYSDLPYNFLNLRRLSWDFVDFNLYLFNRSNFVDEERYVIGAQLRDLAKVYINLREDYE